MASDDFDILKSFGPEVQDKSTVSYDCKCCGSKVSITLKNLKSKVRSGRTLLCRSCSIRDKWLDSGYRKRVSDAQNAVWSNSELKERVSANSKAKWSDPSYVDSQKSAHRTIEYVTATSQRSKALWSDPEYRKRQKVARSSDKYKSNRSETMEKLWSNDNYRTKVLNPNIVIDKINRPLRVSASDVLIDFDFADLEIREIDSSIRKKGVNSEAKRFLDSHHYAQYGRVSKVIFGAYLKDQLIAVCKFANPVRQEVASSIGQKPDETLELDRFCIRPDCHKKNLASWFISRSSKLVFDKLPKVRCLVSFADMTYGHIGTIYKSANWKCLGEVSPDYCYVNAEGWKIHKKTLYNHAVKNKMTESEYAVVHGYRKVYGKEKTKFVFYRP
jgi:hypothetical protein